MIISDKKNEGELLAFIPSIKANMADWQIVSVKIPLSSQDSYDDTVKSLFNLYEHREGILVPVSKSKILILLKLGNVDNYGRLKAEIEQKLPTRDARVLATKMSPVGLKQVHLNLSEKSDHVGPSMHEKREKREENVFLVADDDSFVRQAMAGLLKQYGDVIETGDGSEVKDLYMQYNPDIALLDIHMPNKDGLSLINDITAVDIDAFILIVSGDSVKENVLEAVSGGAMGF
ncbi:MAG: response regulator transcription factor, partial [Bdellovibrionales bacterium]